MVVTRASAKARVMSESDLESFSTPVRICQHHHAASLPPHQDSSVKCAKVKTLTPVPLKTLSCIKFLRK